MKFNNIFPRNASHDGRMNSIRLGVQSSQASYRFIPPGLTSPRQPTQLFPISPQNNDGLVGKNPIKPEAPPFQKALGFTKKQFKLSFDFEKSSMMNQNPSNVIFTEEKLSKKLSPRHRKVASLMMPTSPTEPTQPSQQKVVLKHPSYGMKDQISMDRFLFSSRSTVDIQPFSQGLHRVPTQISEVMTPKIASPRGSTAISARNISTRNISTRQSQGINVEQDCFFKTSLQAHGSKSARKALDEISQSGFFKVSKLKDHSPRASTGVGSDRVVDFAVRESVVKTEKKTGFVINKGIVEANKKKVGTLAAISKEVQQRKQEIQQAIERRREEIMVCVTEENKPYGKLKYCFVGKEGVALPLTWREGVVREDKVEFKIKLHDIQKWLHLDKTYKHVHRLNGVEIFAFSEIPANERVVVIGRKNEIGDISKIMSDDVVLKFMNLKNRVNESMSEAMESLAFLENREDMCREVLNIVENTHQLSSKQLNNLVDLSKKVELKEFSSAVQHAFKNSRVGTIVAETEKAGSIFAEDYFKEEPNAKTHRRASLEALVNPRIEGNRKGSQEEIAHEDNVKRYLQSPKPLTENKKLQAYRSIVQEYDRGMSKIKFQATEEDEQDLLDPDPVLLANAQREKLYIKVMQVDENLEGLLDKWRNANKEVMEEKEVPEDKLERIYSKNLDASEMKKKKTFNSLLSVSKTEKSKEPKSEKNLPFKKPPGRNFIEENARPFDQKKDSILQLRKFHKPLTFKNIPKHLKDQNLSRQELLYVYTVYKALCEVTSQRYKEYNVKDGIDFHSFRHGIFNVAVQSEELGEKLFFAIDKNFSGFLDWNEFLDVMVTIRAKTLHEKIDLFIRIADEDGNGTLSHDEIFTLSKICLGKFIKETPNGFLHNLCEYFTKLIFETMGFDLDAEIPLESMKDAIFSGNPESNLLAMFCGADL